MKRYFFEIAYDGTDFFGWQIQSNQVSVQETIELVLSKLNSNEEIKIVGCGRTDTGVHASSYIFHADMNEIISTEELIFKMNRMLPSSIALFSIQEVHSDQHARFDAKWRTYRYHIHTSKNPFKERFSTYFPINLDVESMNAAAQFLIGKQDFATFSKLNTDVKTTICEVSKAQWVKDSENSIYFEITANRFLRNMVRATVGNLVLVGQGKMSIDDFKMLLDAKDRSKAKGAAEAQGLFLREIEY